MTADQEPDDPQVWLLTAGSYSAYHVVGAFANEAEAQAVLAVLGDTYDDYAVESVPVLSGVTVEQLWTELACSMTIYWHGRTHEHEGEPVTQSVVRGLPGGDVPYVRKRPPALKVEILATEQGYTLGVNLRVYGTDLERVRKVFSEQRAMLIADPATATINAWVRSEHLPRWTFGRAENAALAPHLAEALRAAGKGQLVLTHVDEGS